MHTKSTFFFIGLDCGWLASKTTMLWLLQFWATAPFRQSRDAVFHCSASGRSAIVLLEGFWATCFFRWVGLPNFTARVTSYDRDGSGKGGEKFSTTIAARSRNRERRK